MGPGVLYSKITLVYGILS